MSFSHSITTHEYLCPATPQLFGAIENFNSDPALVPVLRDMGKQVFAPMATSLSNGFAGQVTGSGYFEEVQLLLPKPIVYPQGFIGGPSGNAFGVVGSSPDSYTPYLTFYLPKTLGGILGIPVAYYTVTYDLNGGSGVVPQTTAYIAGTIAPVAGGIGLTHPGFTFSRWKDGSGKVYTTGATFAIQGNIILYAQWVDDGFGISAGNLVISTTTAGVFLEDDPQASHTIIFLTSLTGKVLKEVDNVILFNVYDIPPGCHAVSAYAFNSEGTLIYGTQISI